MLTNLISITLTRKFVMDWLPELRRIPSCQFLYVFVHISQPFPCDLHLTLQLCHRSHLCSSLLAWITCETAEPLINLASYTRSRLFGGIRVGRLVETVFDR